MNESYGTEPWIYELRYKYDDKWEHWGYGVNWAGTVYGANRVACANEGYAIKCVDKIKERYTKVLKFCCKMITCKMIKILKV